MAIVSKWHVRRKGMPRIYKSFATKIEAQTLRRITQSNKSELAIAICGTFEDGDALFIDIGITDFLSDAIYIFEFEADIRIKRLQKIADGKIFIISDNKRYEPLTLNTSQDIRIIGRVVGKWALT